MASSVIRTTCPYCGVGCGAASPPRTARSSATRIIPPITAGCARRARRSARRSATDGRLLHPQIGGRNASWDEALDRIAGAFARTIADHGPDAVALYVSGQFLTEDYYVANKLMKGFIGSANIDTNSRLCMASSVAGHIRAFGEDIVPGCYEDIELADLVVLVGSNTAWCHPVLYQRLAAARGSARHQDRRRSIRAAPRPAISPTCISRCGPAPTSRCSPGCWCISPTSGACDRAWTHGYAAGFDAALDAARRPRRRSPRSRRSPIVPVADLAPLLRLVRRDRADRDALFARRQSVLGRHRQGQRDHQLPSRDRPDRPARHGAVFVDRPAQRDGRARGRRARQPARRAYELCRSGAMSIACGRFWNAPRMATAARPQGRRSVRRGRSTARSRRCGFSAPTRPTACRAPSGCAPRSRACPFVAVSDCWPTDTTRFADIVLPAAGWGEKDGTVTNSERCISRQRAFRAAAGRSAAGLVDAAPRSRGAWAGGDAFAYRSAGRHFPRACRAVGVRERRADARLFDIGALAELSDEDYDGCRRCTGRCRAARPSAGGTARLFGDGTGFTTPDGRARFVPTPYRPPAVPADDQWPLVLNTGRVRDQWHTMTRTGRVPRLMAHQREPLLDIHPGRCGAAASRGRRPGPGREPAWRDRDCRSASRTAQRPRRSVRADALDRSVHLGGADRPPGRRRRPIRYRASRN